MSETRRDTCCPSCGKFVGPYEICPYCQASLESRINLKVFKWIAVGGSIIGLVLLLVGVHVWEVPSVQIGSIDIQYNMAVVRLEGTVTDIKMDPQKDSFQVSIDDGTGKATLNGIGKLHTFTKEMKDQFPRVGDKVAAIGNLSVSESWGITLFLTSPRRIMLLKREEMMQKQIGQITQADVGKNGFFTGKVADVQPFGKGRNVTIKDDTGEVLLTVFDTELKQVPEKQIKALTEPGSQLRFLGRVDLYKEKLQLRLVQPDNPDNLQIISNQ
jgi:hypothetical protein